MNFRIPFSARTAIALLFSGLALVPALSIAAETTFPVRRFDISGNTLIAPDEVAALMMPFIGEAKVYGDIQKALETLEGAYRRRGYSAVQVTIPEQELADGVVRMVVSEAVIGNLVVKGNVHFDEANVLAALPALQKGTTPNSRAISESVQLSNENPAKHVEVVLGVSDRPNEIDARVEVADHPPLGFFVNIDNTGNRQTGRDRVGIAVQHANLFNLDHVATAAYSTSLEKPEQTKIYSLSYRLPIYRWGDSIDVIVAQSDVDAGVSTTVAGPLQFSGRGRVYGLRYNHIFPRLGEYSHRFVVGVDQREYDNACTIAGAAVCGAGGVDITLRPVSLSYVGQQEGVGVSTAFQASYAANFPGARNGGQADFTAARLGATSRYSVWRGNIVHSRALPADWQLRATLGVQYSADRLVAGEQFGLAGSQLVRGFQERAVTADKGAVGGLELYGPELASRAGLPGSLRVLGFFDAASGSFNGLAPGLYQRDTIASVGLGLRYNLGRQLAIRFDTARVTNAGPSGTAASGDWRGHLSVNLGF